MRISDWSSDVCSSDLRGGGVIDRALAVGAGAGRIGAEFEQAPHQRRRHQFGAAGQLQRVVAFAADRGGIGARGDQRLERGQVPRSEEHTSELQSLMRISYAVFCLKKKTTLQHV